MRRVLLLGMLLASSLYVACGPKEAFCPEFKKDQVNPGSCNITADDGGPGYSNTGSGGTTEQPSGSGGSDVPAP